MKLLAPLILSVWLLVGCSSVPPEQSVATVEALIEDAHTAWVIRIEARKQAAETLPPEQREASVAVAWAQYENLLAHTPNGTVPAPAALIVAAAAVAAQMAER